MIGLQRDLNDCHRKTLSKSKTTKVYQLKKKVHKIPQTPTPPNLQHLHPPAKILNLGKIPNFTNLSPTLVKIS